MKIVFITNNYPPVVDGVGDYTWFISNELQKKGFEVHVICKESAEILQYNSASSIKVWPVVTSWDKNGFKRAYDIIDNISPDWLFIQYVPYSFQKWGMPFRFPFIFNKYKGTTVRILLTVHEPYIRLQWQPLRFFLVGQVQRIALWLLARRVERVVTSIDRYVALIGKYTLVPITLVPIPSNITPVAISIDVLNDLRKKIAPGKQRIISTFGIRDHQLLVNVFKEILKTEKNVRLLVTGVTSARAVYKDIEDYVYTTGYCAESEIYSYLKASDVFFMPDPIKKGTEGGTSNKSGSLAAAFAADLPIVGTKGDMNNKLLIEAPYVFLEPAEEVTIAKRIVQILNDPSPKSGNHLFWQQHLSPSSVANAYADLLLDNKQ